MHTHIHTPGHTFLTFPTQNSISIVRDKSIKHNEVVHCRIVSHCHGHGTRGFNVKILEQRETTSTTKLTNLIVCQSDELEWQMNLFFFFASSFGGVFTLRSSAFTLDDDEYVLRSMCTGMRWQSFFIVVFTRKSEYFVRAVLWNRSISWLLQLTQRLSHFELNSV